jgi:hypothetical protein
MHARLANQRAGLDRRHVLHHALRIDFHAVIPAGKAITQIPAFGKARAAMWATILQRMHAALAIAPQHDVFTQSREAQRRRAHFPTCRDGVPQVAQPMAQIMFDIVLANHAYAPCQ